MKTRQSQTKETFAEAMKKSPKERLAWLLVGNEDEKTLRDIKKAVRENNKEILYIYGLRKFFYEYAAKEKAGKKTRKKENK